MRRLKTGRTPSRESNELRSSGVQRELQKRAISENTFRQNQDIATGETWVDGKDIYRRTIETGALPNATTKPVPHGIQYQDIVEIWGIANNGTGAFLPMPYASGSTRLGVYVDEDNVILATATDLTAYTTSYTTIKFTK